MSDGEGGGGKNDDELGLPKATVQKLIQEMMPADLTCAKDTRDLLSECCVQQIIWGMYGYVLIIILANEACEKDAKKTIAGEHTLGFDEYIEEVKELCEDHNKQLKDREKRSNKLENSNMSPEELERLQAALFEKSKQTMQAPPM
ncbi:negative cofactor 2 transcription regulator complex subunit ncb2 [Irineochytrium annulatum]|nr:negative cofactor 2 transcription regulator complex subunit ncb2 [Irineochytrium annulatum]